MATLFIFAMVCSIFLQKAELKNGFYYGYSEGVYVQINEDGTFVYRVALGISTAVDGEYVVENEYLTLYSDVGEYKFRILHNKIEFIEGNYLTDDLVEKGTKYVWKEKYYD